MNIITEQKVVDFLRDLSSSKICFNGKSGIEKALELLFEITDDERYIKVGQFRVKKSSFKLIWDYMVEKNKIQAIKVLRIIYGDNYSLSDYKRAVETLDISE